MNDPEQYRDFQIVIGEMFKGRKSAVRFQLGPKMIYGSPAETKKVFLDFAERAVEDYLKEINKTE